MATRSKLVIGVDFDNTLAVYDELFWTMATEKGLLRGCAAHHKREIRDAIRRMPDGEVEWQRLQAAAYGPRIGEARPAEGAAEFLAHCRRAAVELYVLSHKTERARYDETNTNLRRAAVQWMQRAGMFRWLAPEAIRFAATRPEKVAWIRELRCTHFIDDLEETFLEKTFPLETERILYRPNSSAPPGPGILRMTSWKQIGEYLFGVRI